MCEALLPSLAGPAAGSGAVWDVAAAKTRFPARHPISQQGRACFMSKAAVSQGLCSELACGHPK